MVAFAALFATLNARFLRLPQAIGLTMLGALSSGAVILASRVMPELQLQEWARGFIDSLDFRKTLLEGMLSFLLFAGAFHIDLNDMRRGRWTILALSSFGTVLSTLLVGFGLKGVFLLLGGPDMPLSWCLVFGALISPTDPVAVIAILKDAWLPKPVQATVAAESLFNDGVGVVLFTILFAAASGGGDVTVPGMIRLFIVEAGGGVIFGLAIGGLAFVAMRGMADYVAEVLVTLAVVMGGYAAANALHVSGPVAMAVAGLFLGNHGVRYALSETGQDYVVTFWLVIDEILNSVLFLLVGLEAIVVWHEGRLMAIGLIAIPLVLAARLISVGLPLVLLRRIQHLGPAALPVLTWGGLRGGISIALALSIPKGPNQALILTATYAVVVFSVMVQGLTIGRLARRYRPEAEAACA